MQGMNPDPIQGPSGYTSFVSLQKSFKKLRMQHLGNPK